MVTIVFYVPDENVSLANAALSKRLDNHFSSWPESQMQALLGKKRTPCVLATVTDSESVAFRHEQADDSAT